MNCVCRSLTKPWRLVLALFVHARKCTLILCKNNGFLQKASLHSLTARKFGNVVPAVCRAINRLYIQAARQNISKHINLSAHLTGLLRPFSDLWKGFAMTWHYLGRVGGNRFCQKHSTWREGIVMLTRALTYVCRKLWDPSRQPLQPRSRWRSIPDWTSYVHCLSTIIEIWNRVVTHRTLRESSRFD